MAYTRKSETITFSCHNKLSRLSQVSAVTDLGVVFNSTVRFNSHSAQIVNISLPTLSVACHVTEDFKTPVTFFLLFMYDYNISS